MVPGNQDWDRALTLKQKETEEGGGDRREGNRVVSKVNSSLPSPATIRARNLIALNVVSLNTQNKCTKKDTELKCKAHPNSNSHADLACFYHRRAHGLHILTRPRPDGSRDSSRSIKSPVAANFAHAEDNESVDHTEIFTSDDESHEVNSIHEDEDTDGVDSTAYYSEGNDDVDEDRPQAIPPTPPRPRN